MGPSWPTWGRVLALLLLVPALLPCEAAALAAGDELATRAARALYDGITQTELPNGLRIYLKPVPGASSVTTVLAYKAGSCDEDKTSTGLAHYLEHLLFKGTAKLRPGDIDRLTFRAGGSNNAYTKTDLTAYHFTLPAGRWRVALEVEADRMRNTAIDKAHEFDKEKGAVINELAAGEDTPWDLEYKAVLPLLYGKTHPYGHPVIGESAHVRAATEKIIRGFYDRWYHPNNAALVLVGGFKPDEALPVVRKLFSGIPRGKLPPRKPEPAVKVKLPARVTMRSKFSQPRLLWAVRTVKSGEADHAALAVLQNVLGLGKRSRLYRALVEGGHASAVEVEHQPGRYPGYLSISVDVLPGKKLDDIERLLLIELAKTAEGPPSEAELKRVKRQMLASAVFAREGTAGLAKSIAEAAIVNDLDFAKKYLPAVLAVTGEDVHRVAKKYLRRERSASVRSLPAGRRGPGHWGGPPRKRTALAEKGLAGGVDLSRTKRVVLPNGLTVLLYKNPGLPTFEAHVSLREGPLHQKDEKLGVASLAGTLLDEGTKTRTGQQIAEAIEGMGGELSLGAAGGSVKVLSPDWKKGLGTLFDCLLNADFPADAFLRGKRRLLARAMEDQAEPDRRASSEFDKLVYGKHPLGRPARGTVETIKGLDQADCRAYHKLVFVPNNAIVAVVGDFDVAAVEAELRRLTAGWKKKELPKRAWPKVGLPDKFTEKVITMREAAQLHFYMGHVGVRRSNPDYYRLLVMDYILGTGPGFTDRLSSRLRDREGLAYTVQAVITSSAGVEPGRFTCYIGTDSKNYAKVKRLFLEELNRIRKEKVGKQELADAKSYLQGSYQLGFGTNGGTAGQLLEIELHGLGLDEPKKFHKAVGEVTAEDVLAVAKKYLHPSKMVVVAAGAVDEKGGPLDAGKKE